MATQDTCDITEPYRPYGADHPVAPDDRDQVQAKLISDAKEINVGGKPMVYWPQGYIGPIYTTSINLTILQLEKGTLPIYQR